MLKKNTTLCDLDKISKIELKQKAFEHNLNYKNCIGLSKQIRFGVEVEAIGSDFINKMRRKRGVVYYYDPELAPSDIYKKHKWVLTRESTLELEDGECVYPRSDGDFILSYNDFDIWLNRRIPSKGGEVASPILSDDYCSWRNVKKMLKYMKRHVSDLRINYSCASQVHFDIGIFNNNPEVLYSFMVLLAETEPVLTRFFCGEYINLRSMADEWAKPFDEFFLSSLSSIEHNGSYGTMLDNLRNIKGERYKAHSFDFSNVYFGFGKCNNTFENRIPNGTLTPEIIQNNVMLMGFLMEYALDGNYDYEKGMHNIKSGRDYNDLSDELAFYVADMLPNEQAQLDFLTQYYKDGLIADSKKLIKSSRIFY